VTKIEDTSAPGRSSILSLTTFRLRRHRRGHETGTERSASATLAAIGIHVLVVIAFANAIHSATVGVSSLRAGGSALTRLPHERLQYTSVTAVPTREVGAEARPAPKQKTDPLIAPSDDVPTPRLSRPSLEPSATARATVDVGPPNGIMRGRGLVPDEFDPRHFPEARVAHRSVKSFTERADSIIATSIDRHRDSLADGVSAASGEPRRDWVHRTGGGMSFGIETVNERQYIRLGTVSVPSPVLALLGFKPVQGNPIERDRQTRIAAMRADIVRGALTARNAAEFRQAARDIRARHERARDTSSSRPN
jgi:hypothetical protein